MMSWRGSTICTCTCMYTYGSIYHALVIIIIVVAPWFVESGFLTDSLSLAIITITDIALHG